MDEQAPTRRRQLVWMAIIMVAVVLVIGILTSRWRGQWVEKLLPRQLVADTMPVVEEFDEVFGMNFFQATIPFEAWTGRVAFGLMATAMILLPLGMFLSIRRRSWM